MAAAIGQSCEIPILLRTLACHLYQTDDPFTLPSDRDFLLGLDAGNEYEDMSAAVDSYLLPWWNDDGRPTDHQIINFSNMEEALSFHRTVTGTKGFLPIKMTKEKYTWPRQISFDPKGLPMDCDRCRLYRGVSLGVLDNLQDLRHQVHGLEVASEYRSDMAERRAAGLFQLYDAALMKELGNSHIKQTTGKRPQKPSGSMKRQAEFIRKTAAAELNRLTNLPSMKWTWGPDLDVNDVLDLKHLPVPSGARQHSGYNSSLPLGPFAAGSCATGSLSSTSFIASDIADDTMDVPELNNNEIPTDFSCFPFRNLTDDPHPLIKISGDLKPIDPPRPESSWLEPPSKTFFPPPPDVVPTVPLPSSADSDDAPAACDVYSDTSSDDGLDINGTEAARLLLSDYCFL